VADLRASTPSSAIEMILPDSKEILYTMSELQDRFVYAMKERLTQCTRELKYRETLLLRSSPLRKIEELSDKFSRIEDEFSRVMKHLLEHQALALPKLQKQYAQTMGFTLDNKAQALSFIEKNIALHHPKNQCRTGWAKTSVEGKVVELSALQNNQTFILEDEFTKIEALCLSRY
jgi:exodeoxyribonuclease VII large subunit